MAKVSAKVEVSLEKCFLLPVRWSATTDIERPWRARVGKAKWETQLNNFPDEPLYTLFVDGEKVGDFDDWPPSWEKPAKLRQHLQALAGTEAILTSREREILALLRAGHTNREIGVQLFISPETVKWHMRRLLSKIGAKDRLAAALHARENNVVPRQEKAPAGATLKLAGRKP